VYPTKERIPAKLVPLGLDQPSSIKNQKQKEKGKSKIKTGRSLEWHKTKNSFEEKNKIKKKNSGREKQKVS
jgi:hypothetical protein